jgi:AmmeMemoRadiSam system protein A
MSLALTQREQITLLEVAREAIGARLARRPAVYPPVPTSLEEMRGVFVTLKKHGDLRGCIGHISACRPLVEAVKDAAVSSAFSDPRFPPLTQAEWPRVRIEISVLSAFVAVTDPSCIAVGVHGVMVRSGYRSGLLLPQVATEQGWDRETFLGHACRKAGLPSDAWRGPGASIESFTATVFHEPQE